MKMNKEEKYCSTNPIVCKKMVEKLNLPYILPHGFKILDPQSGTGALIKALPLLPETIEVSVEYCEIDQSRAQKTRDTYNVTFRDWDFLKYPVENKYDRIISVPPFFENQWLEHTYKAFLHLYERNSKMVILLPEIALDNVEFTNWVSFNKGTFEKVIGCNSCDYECETVILEITK